MHPPSKGIRWQASAISIFFYSFIKKALKYIVYKS